MCWLIDKRLLAKSGLAISIICLFASLTTFAQDKCDPEAILTQATDEFNAGHFYGIEALLTPCMGNKTFTKEQLVRAYQLLTQTHLILENPEAAEASYLNLLKANPEYICNPERDPIDVVYLSKKFTATPIFSWFVNVGGNISIPRVLIDYEVNAGSDQEYTLKPRWYAGGGIIWNYNDRLTAEAGLNFSNNTFGYFEDKIFVDDQLTMTETQYSLQLPISIKYTHVRQKLSPYIYAGVTGGLLLSSRQNFLFIDKTPGATAGEGLEQSAELELNNRFRRDLLNRSLHVGIGFKWKYKLDYLFVDARYGFGLNNIVRDNNLVRDKDDIFPTSVAALKVGYVDDYFRLDQAMITVGYIKPLYKPRKLKRARTTKGVLKDVKNQTNE
ncbi:MAG: PorT family protein [Cytophagia bacterium]|nr:PorT family protein [Cytophagia bacterium]